MPIYLLWFVIFLPFLLALLVFYRFSKKNVSLGYLLGCMMIFLCWHLVALVTLSAPGAIPGRIQGSDPGDSFDILFGDLICMTAILYTVLSIGLTGMYQWFIGKGIARRPERRALITLGLAGFLVFLTFACIYGISRIVLVPSGENLFDLGYWHWRIIRHGMTPIYVIDGFLLVLALVWGLSAWIGRKRSRSSRC
jgi:hypothetical protein